MSESVELRYFASAARHDGREADARALDRIADTIDRLTRERDGATAMEKELEDQVCLLTAEKITAQDEARRKALEEAAKVLENRVFWRDEGGEKAAEIVRDLISISPQGE